MKEIEIHFGAFDSELQGFEYTIPDGYTAEIVDGKIIVKKEESEDERIRKAIKLLVEMKENDSIGLESVYGASYTDMIAWLEKQKEQRTT